MRAPVRNTELKQLTGSVSGSDQSETGRKESKASCCRKKGGSDESRSEAIDTSLASCQLKNECSDDSTKAPPLAHSTEDAVSVERVLEDDGGVSGIAECGMHVRYRCRNAADSWARLAVARVQAAIADARMQSTFYIDIHMI